MAALSPPRHRRKCLVCTKLMRGGDNHPDKSRSCHGCTVDHRCDTCSKWTDKVWACIVERNKARLARKRHSVSETRARPTNSRSPASSLDLPSDDKRLRSRTSSMSSGIGFSHVDFMSDTSCLVLDTFHEPLCRLCVITYQDYMLFIVLETRNQYLVVKPRPSDKEVGAVGVGCVFIILVLASNLGAAKSIAPCEATEPGKYVTCKCIF